MNILFYALTVSALGVFPLLSKRKFGTGVVVVCITTLLWWLVFYLFCPLLIWPLLGLYGAALMLNFLIAAVVDSLQEDKASWMFSLPVILLLLFGIRGCSGWHAFRSRDYANLIGKVEIRNWTQDTQPSDPKHLRMVPAELAAFMADKQLGEAPGTLGSQYHVAKEYLTLQKINGELWWVAPLDYDGFSVWTSVGNTPGFVMVHAEDQNHQIQLKTGYKFKYTPDAFLWDNLQRHVWKKTGCGKKGITDYSFEIDEDGKPWWVVTIFKPTISFWGNKVTGVLVVNPETGDDTFYPADSISKWVDRAVPQEFTSKYIEEWGVYSNGWVNSWWGKKSLQIPTPFRNQKAAVWIVYGSDGEPYWFTGITSRSSKDQALVGLLYLHSRTGEARLYQASGLNEDAVVTTVENAVKYKLLHASPPILYNIYGMMTWVVPLLGESHTFQGVALVKADTLQTAIGSNQYEALREYQKIISESGQQIAPSFEHEKREVSGKVLRIASDTRKGETTYYILLEESDVLFSGAIELSSELPLTKIGDEVKAGYLATTENVVPMLYFDNLNLQIKESQLQAELRKKVEERQEIQQGRIEERDTDKKVENMSPEELRKALKESLKK